MAEQSARFALPFILPGQAQKEMFHNEALAMIDGLIQPAVQEILAAPPADPAPGQCWIVGAGATGAWAGHENALAVASGAGWRMLAPTDGMQVWDMNAGVARRWTGSAWSDGAVAATGLVVAGDQVVGPRQPEIADPTGGSTIDVEARGAVVAIIVALKSHGLID